MADVRVTQGGVEALVAVDPTLRVTHTGIEVLVQQLAEDVHSTQALLEVLYGPPPSGGGAVPPSPEPPIVDAQTGLALRVFVEIKGYAPSAPPADPIRTMMFAETELRDPPAWYAGRKEARLIGISPITRELSGTGEFRGTECRILLADPDRTFRTYGSWGPLVGAYCAVYVVSDAVRYAHGEPFRLFAGLIQEHGARPGFQYKLIVQDILSSRLAVLDESPRIPPYKLTLADFPGMDQNLEGQAAQIVLGEASDELIPLPDRGPQGVIPPQRLGVLNFQAMWGGADIEVDAYIWSQAALVSGGVWNVYIDDPDVPDKRIPVDASSYGVDVWTPGKPGWAMTGLSVDYVDYNGRRYTPFFVRRAHPWATPAREGKVLIAGNLYGVAENGDGTGPYLDSAARLWQWIIVNQLFVPYTQGPFAPVPLLDKVTYGIIDTDSVESAHAAHHQRVPGGYVVGVLLGREGKQETLRHVLGELCAGSDMEQGINRHGQGMLSVETLTEEPIVTLTDLLDIEDAQFETWIEAGEYFNRIEHQYGWRYVPPSAPIKTPAEGEPLPVRAIPKEQQQWTSGLVVREHAAAVAAHNDEKRTKHLDNYVVRSPAVAASLETTLLARAVGPEPMFEGPLYFRLRTGWQGLGVQSGAPIELGSLIAITHTEGFGRYGYVAAVARVLKITVDPLQARVTLEGRLLGASSPAVPPPASCDVVIWQETFDTTPLYPTDSPGGPSYSSPDYWEHPLFGAHVPARYGPPLPTYPQLVIAEQAIVVDGTLQSDDPGAASAVFGIIGTTAPRYNVLQPVYNPRALGAVAGFAEVAVTYLAEAWFGSGTYAPLLGVHGEGLSQRLLVALYGVSATDGGVELTYETWSTNEEPIIVPVAPVAPLFGTTDIWRIEWQAATLAPDEESLLMDGFVRVRRNGVVVFERLNFDLYISDDYTTEPPTIGSIYGVSVGYYQFAGAYDNLTLGYMIC